MVIALLWTLVFAIRTSGPDNNVKFRSVSEFRAILRLLALQMETAQLQIIVLVTQISKETTAKSLETSELASEFPQMILWFVPVTDCALLKIIVLAIIFSLELIAVSELVSEFRKTRQQSVPEMVFVWKTTLVFATPDFCSRIV